MDRTVAILFTCVTSSAVVPSDKGVRSFSTATCLWIRLHPVPKNKKVTSAIVIPRREAAAGHKVVLAGINLKPALMLAPAILESGVVTRFTLTKQIRYVNARFLHDFCSRFLRNCEGSRV